MTAQEAAALDAAVTLVSCKQHARHQDANSPARLGDRLRLRLLLLLLRALCRRSLLRLRLLLLL
jgi:hypothetical protein